MENKNTSIGCTVNECKHHYGTEDYCTLNHIEVVKHHTPTNNCEETDCSSFQK